MGCFIAAFSIKGGWEVYNGLRTGTLRTRGRGSWRKYSRRSQPRQFWANVILNSSLVVVGAILAGNFLRVLF
jgi:hypothetical protein